MPQCKLKSCSYGRDGRCVENQLPNCPNLLPEAKDESKAQEKEVISEAESSIESPEHEVLYSGNKLTVNEATLIRQAVPTQLIVLGGMVESGKTTLLARIFEMFQRGPVARYFFAGSRTLTDFDKLSWHATMECGADIATTEHTYRSENNLFLHLRVRHEEGSLPPTDLLIADIPGELFPDAVAEQSVCEEICALQPANHVVLFLDGGVLCDATKRHDHCGKVVDFVSRALQTRQIGLHTILHLVVSKCDLLPQDLTNGVLKFVANTEATFKKRFNGKFGGLYTWRISSRPHNADQQPTLGNIEKMFETWVTPLVVGPGRLLKVPLETRCKRDFCRFGL